MHASDAGQKARPLQSQHTGSCGMHQLRHVLWRIWHHMMRKCEQSGAVAINCMRTRRTGEMMALCASSSHPCRWRGSSEVTASHSDVCVRTAERATHTTYATSGDSDGFLPSQQMGLLLVEECEELAALLLRVCHPEARTGHLAAGCSRAAPLRFCTAAARGPHEKRFCS